MSVNGNLLRTARTLRVVAGPHVRRSLSAVRGIRAGKRLRPLPLGTPVPIHTADGLRLEGLLYLADPPAPGIVVLHSSDPMGQRHGLYVALARAMQARGFSTLTFNMRGYPGSDRPADDAGFSMTGLVRDVQAALQVFVETGRVKAGRVALYGHSYGAGVVLPAMHATPGFWKGIVHSPPDWNGPRITAPEAPEQALFLERFWRYMSLGRPVNRDVFLALNEALDLFNQRDLVCTGDNVLLVQGEREGRSMQTFMQAALEFLPAPHHRLLVPGADHFCNTVALRGWLIADPRAITGLADGIANWLRTGTAP